MNIGVLLIDSSANLPQFSKDARLLAALDEENDGDRLLDAARRLAGAFSELLTAAQPENQEVSQCDVIARSFERGL